MATPTVKTLTPWTFETVRALEGWRRWGPSQSPKLCDGTIRAPRADRLPGAPKTLGRPQRMQRSLDLSSDAASSMGRGRPKRERRTTAARTSRSDSLDTSFLITSLVRAQPRPLSARTG